MKMRWYINLHKVLTAPVVLAMMAFQDQWENPTAWVYLALHGTYGLLWVWKSRIFPDKSWERQASLGFGLVIWLALTLYWIAPWLITSGGVQAPYALLAVAISLFVIGGCWRCTGYPCWCWWGTWSSSGPRTCGARTARWRVTPSLRRTGAGRSG